MTTPSVVADEELVERVAIALSRALKRDCVARGECYAHADDAPTMDGMGAEVDGEFDLLSLASAALAASDRDVLVADALETARQRAIVLFQAYARGVTVEYGRGEAQFMHDVTSFGRELADALDVPISRAALVPLGGGV